MRLEKITRADGRIVWHDADRLDAIEAMVAFVDPNSSWPKRKPHPLAKPSARHKLIHWIMALGEAK